MMEWEATSSQEGKKPIVDKTPNSYLFFHLNIKEPPPYPRDIWVPTLPIDLNRYVKICKLL